jgi:hypothetical protein
MYKRSVIESHASDKELMNYILDFPLGVKWPITNRLPMIEHLFTS